VKLNGTNNANKNASNNKNGNISMSQASMQLVAPPISTFQNIAFEELLAQYEGLEQKIQSSVQLNQALLMSSNLKETSGVINGQSIAEVNGGEPNQNLIDTAKVGQNGDNTGGSYFYKADYMSDLTKKCASKDLSQINKLLANIGT
jgi:hypothetical protein